MIALVCPKCHAKINAPEKAEGRHLPCPRCGAKIAVYAAITALPPPPVPAAPSSLPPPPAVPSVSRRQSRDDNRDEDRDDRPRRHDHERPLPAKGNSFLTGIGLGTGIAIGVGGVLFLCVVACCGFIVMPRATQRIPAPLAVADNPAPVEELPAPPPKPAPAKPAPPREPSAPARLSFGQVGTFDRVDVSIVEARCGHVPLIQSFTRKRGRSTEPYLTFKIKIRNGHPTRIVTYRSWGELRSLFDDIARVVDSHGNRYTRYSRNFALKQPGEIDRADLHQGDNAWDVLSFTRASKTAAHFDLDLPLANLGLDGTAKFRVLQKQITWADDGEADDDE